MTPLVDNMLAARKTDGPFMLSGDMAKHLADEVAAIVAERDALKGATTHARKLRSAKWAAYREATDDERRAEKAKLATMEALYPVGAEIRWRHGDRLIHGVVTGHEARGDRLWYYNPRTGKRHFVYIGSVLDEMEGRPR